ncbi:MFS transporter [Streptomyces sp. NPDC002917]|uniref:MFS transporter n=1 Tax=Streptomyces sp. NPDC002917 TaxID=3364671 RepID=UPI003676D7B2
MLPPFLRQSDFRWFFAGRLVSLLGSSMAPVALAFAVLNASGRAGDLGIVLAAHMVPLLGFLLVGGATADRVSRRTVLIAANLGSGLTQAMVAALLLSGHYSLLAVSLLTFLNGLLAAFTTPALRGLVPELVARSDLQRANSLLATVTNGTKVFGPSICGVLVGSAGSGTAIACDALSYLVAAACLARLPATVGATAAAGADRSPLLRDLREGWAVFRGTAWVWPVTLSFCVVNLVQTGAWQILGPQLTEQLSGEAMWGFVLSARGVGMLLMSTVMYRLTVRYLARFGQLASVLGALPLLALGMRMGAPLLIAAAFTAGLGSAAAATAWDTSLQEHIPDGVLSRVAAYDDLLSYIAIPIGQLLIGPLAQRFGGFHVATAAALCYAGVVLLPLASPALRRLPHTSFDRRTPSAAQAQTTEDPGIPVVPPRG